MMYFGWKTPLWGSFLLTDPHKANFSILALTAEFLLRSASFELRLTEVGRTILKLFYSTFRLEIPIPAPKTGSFGGVTPQMKDICVVIPIGTSLAQTTSLYIIW
jgi:hypothetical protein